MADRHVGSRGRMDGEGQMGSGPARGSACGRAEKIRVRWEGMYRGKVQEVEGGGGGRKLIRFGTYNIRNGKNGGLESALQGTEQYNVNGGVFQETKLRVGIYTRGSS